MKVTSISSRQLKKLPELQLSSKIINTEAKLYIYDYKDAYLRYKSLMKIFYIQSSDYIANKLCVISQLISGLIFLN